MIALLIVTKEKRQLKKVVVDKDCFIIGRSAQCDLALADESMASRQHVELTRDGDVYWVRDRGSRNGTLLNGKPLVERKILNDGDEIDVGASRLKFILDRHEPECDEPPSGATKVMELSGENSRGIGQKIVSKTGKKDWHVTLSIVEGPFAGGTVADWEQPLLIGRGLDNHIVLLDDAASIHHARIICDGEQHILVDLDSSNGTFVDGIKVKREILENGRRIKIGLSTLLFKKCNLRKQRRLRNRIILSTVILGAILGGIKVLQPPDVAGRYVKDANALMMHGELEKSLENYQSALKIDSSRAEAKEGVKAVQLALAARKSLAEAELAAGTENYEKAKELCYQVLRNAPNNIKARELDAVIKSIENAKVAFASKNWRDAVSLLQKARDAFPNSSLVTQRLAEAERELAAEQSLTKAKDCLQHQQADMAQDLLNAIPESSVYFIEARERLDGITSNRKTTEYLNRAKTKYQKGMVPEALVEIDNGLQESPANTSLLGLRDRIRQVEPLVGSLLGAEAMDAPDDVAILWRHLQACENLLRIEDDPLNGLRKRAGDAKSRISARLKELSRESVLKAETSVQAGNQKEGLRLYKMALQSDTNNATAIQAMEQVQKRMTAAARSAYQKGIVHEELGQADLARAAFKAVLELSAPDEEYYVRAARKLKDYAQ